MKSRVQFHRDYRAACKRRQCDKLAVYAVLAVAVALWVPLILLLTVGWGA